MRIRQHCIHNASGFQLHWNSGKQEDESVIFGTHCKFYSMNMCQTVRLFECTSVFEIPVLQNWHMS